MVECKSRGAQLMAVTTYGNYSIEDTAEFVTYIPKINVHFAASLAVIPVDCKSTTVYYPTTFL